MPTVLTVKGYRFFFYSNDHSPTHIHIEKDNAVAKFSLDPIELLRSKRFKADEINEIRRIVIDHVDFFKTKWNENFNIK